MSGDGINVVLNKQLFHFIDPDELYQLLDEHADIVNETDKANGVYYDDER